MTKLEFLTELEAGLQRVPQEERENAVNYYTEYFEDAGPENEAAVLEELGDPAKIAQKIAAESMVRDIVAVPTWRERKQQQNNSRPKEKKGLSAVWIAILAIFVSPIAFPVAIVLVAVAFALVVAALAVVFAFFAVAIAFVAAGIFCVVLGFGVLTAHFLTGVCAIGTGIALSGLGLLLFLPLIALARALFQAIARLISRWVMKGGAAQ